ncbi:transcriptional regulator [Terasakiispira papahanaumokuakeensis]|uniref:Transcriptional regulator n=1 Tax=Terasakiispira papahanaumokuakeensis TaxID=197479 RepID=A0A1E2V5K3_9GAMM|nr:helix-turn-helix transcriptional regulator [Terasakiispira papahanaumokuakeensis]ODC02261.1 transcriptional regulator [Terasakiispira papahanaumokuakeensis]
MSRMSRTRSELADFLTTRRARLKPEQVGLPAGQRRRTPGLRREEVAALAGVGVSWYTWLEQGREIGVSSLFLERLAEVFRLDEMERRHLFLLAHQRLPVETGINWCQVPPIVQQLMNELPYSPCYVMNLRWDILAWNTAADRLFSFSKTEAAQRNLIWMLYAHEPLRQLIHQWEINMPRILSSFRRDYVNAREAPDFKALVQSLMQLSPEFKQSWSTHAVDAPCQGLRDLNLPGLGVIQFQHTRLLADEQHHLSLVYYTPQPDHQETFREWLSPYIG